MDNGLPSNKVYCALIDSFGYLWLGTAGGVVKYNGYECKVFDQEAGLPSADVWQLCLDRKGRIWIGTIAGEIGYIKGDSYHKAYFPNKGKTIRPDRMVRYNTGVAFTSPFVSGNPNNAFCIEHNDSFSIISLFFKPFLERDSAKKINDDVPNFFPQVGDDGSLYVLFDSALYSCQIKGHSIDKISLICATEKRFFEECMRSGYMVSGRFLCANRSDYNYEYSCFDLKTLKLITIDIRKHGVDRKIVSVHQSRVRPSLLMIASTNCAIILDGSADTPLISVIARDKSLEGAEEWGKFLLAEHSSWGLVYKESNSVMITGGQYNRFQRAKFSLDGYACIGSDYRQQVYWYNKKTKDLLLLSRNKQKRHFSASIQEPSGFIVVDSNRVRFLNRRILELNTQTGKIEDLGSFDPRVIKEGVSLHEDTAYGVHFYCFSKLIFLRSNHGLKVMEERIEIDRFNGLAYHGAEKIVYAYNRDRVVKYKVSTRTLEEIPKTFFANLQIRHIDKLCIDEYGNLFVRDNASIYLINEKAKTKRQLFGSLNCAGATMRLEHNQLAVAGKFGVSFVSSIGYGRLTEETIYPNVKSQCYKYLYDWSRSDSELLLKTESGVFSIMQVNEADNPGDIKHYWVVATTDSITKQLRDNDTLILSTREFQIRFDIINTHGNGKCKLFSRVSDSLEWQRLVNSVLSIGTLQSGQYYTYTILATDDVWKSQPLTFVVYITPTWWESMLRSKAFYVGAAVVLILVIVLIVYVTRRVVTESNKRKNLRQDIELKSVYSQINPHFIFNSLNTSLYFIKKNRSEEAFSHVSKFAYLLRSYISSSRNKFITVAEEMNNLETYILLQQERFEDKFNYTIAVEGSLDIHSTKIPALLLQPLVENAIEHGLFHKSEVGNLRVVFRGAMKGFVQCIVDDDGVGRKKSKQLSTGSLVKKESFGDTLVKDLINIFNKYEKIKISIDYFDKVAPETGTIVTVNIKYP